MSLRYDLEYALGLCPWSVFEVDDLDVDALESLSLMIVEDVHCMVTFCWLSGESEPGFSSLYILLRRTCPKARLLIGQNTSVDQVTANHRLGDHLSEPSHVYGYYCVWTKALAIFSFIAGQTQFKAGPVFTSSIKTRSTIHHQYNWTISQYNIFVYVSKSKYILYH